MMIGDEMKANMQKLMYKAVLALEATVSSNKPAPLKVIVRNVQRIKKAFSSPLSVSLPDSIQSVKKTRTTQANESKD